MCRFVGYVGREILLADLISRPENSLIRQSYKARERREPLNGDGFGVGWYAPEITNEPGVFTSITPAWSNRNLLNLAEHIESSCFFAHIRAASPGMRVSEANCHPFRHNRFLWMHNGTIEGFSSIKRRLRRSLPDELYQSIEGTTDSEHAFAVFLNLLGGKAEKTSAADLAGALVKTIWQLEEWGREAGISQPSIYNFAVADGQNIATVRYVSDPKIEPISLYFSNSGKYKCCDGRPEITDCCADEEGGIIIASERLTDRSEDWTRIAPNHVAMIDAQLNVNVRLMPDV
jgi:predicted glutamine amidotransferase